MRRLARLLASVASLASVTLLAAGCTGVEPDAAPATGAPTAPSPSAAPATGDSARADLVGFWRVDGGADDGAWLRLDAGGLDLLRECGVVTGAWNATDELLVADPWGWSGEGCTTDSVPWLDEVTAYRLTDGRVELLDDDGAVVVALRADGAPTAAPADTNFTSPPGGDGNLAAWAARPAALPGTVSPATEADLTRHPWLAAGAFETKPGVAFDEAGRYTSTDGCNGVDGRWAVGPDGWFVATSGPQTMIGCDGAPVPSWIASAARAGMDGDSLVLFGADGQPLGTLVAGS